MEKVSQDAAVLLFRDVPADRQVIREWFAPSA
jgi:hypothetical protein